MIGIEKDILLLISRVRCITETQVGKVFGTRRRYTVKPFKKTLRKMCNDYTLKKYPCNINYCGYRDNSYVYYLNGGKTYKGKDLEKVIIGSELVIKINLAGGEVKRFYRNVKVDKTNYDIFIEYIDPCNVMKQILVDIDLDNSFNIAKYRDLDIKIKNSTIPFVKVPKVLIITSSCIKQERISNIDCDISFIDTSLNKLFKNI